MAQNMVELGVLPESVLVIATGGAARARQEFSNGQATGETVKRNNADVHRLSGVALSVAGRGLDGATVETGTPLETIAAGAIFKAEGEVTVSVRADAKPGFNGGAPRGVLQTTVYIERLTPVGDISSIIRGAEATTSRKDVG